MKSHLRRLLLCAAFSLLPLFQLHAAWQPGLRCGYHVNGNDLALAPIWTNTSLDTVAATNWCGWGLASAAPVVTNGAATSVWSVYRAWYYWGEIYLEAGEVAFGGSIDDVVHLEIDGEEILHNTSNGKVTATRTFAEAGWHRFSLKVADVGGGAGPSGQNGVDKSGFGFAIKEKGATAWSYPADDGTMKRYRYDDGLGFPDWLIVTALPEEAGEVTPPYGEHKGYAQGDTIACSAPATIDLAKARYVLDGYVLRTNSSARAEWKRGTSADVPFEFLHPGSTTVLEWLYRGRYLLEVFTTAGGTVSGTTGWHDRGTAVVLTAVPEEGGTFLRWLGDLPEEADPFSPVLGLTIDRPYGLTAMFQTAKLEEKTFTGADGGSWEDSGNWTPTGVPTVSSRVFIPEGVRVRVAETLYAASLTVSNNAAISVFGATTAKNSDCTYAFFGTPKNSDLYGREALDHETTVPLSVEVHGDVTLLGSAQLLVGGHFQRCPATIAIDGDLVLSGTSAFDIYPGPVKDFHETGTFGATLSVGGRTELGGESVLTVYNQLDHYVLGGGKNGTSAPVFLDLHGTTVGKGASILSYAGTSYFTSLEGPWKNGFGTTYVGGGHGAKGGAGCSSSSVQISGGGKPYGNELAPILPGAYGRDFICMGGGVVRLHATDLVVNGTIDVTPFAVIVPWEYGGSSGGSIWLTCDTFALGPKALLRAEGQPGGKYSNHNCGGGAGGRIAVGIGLTKPQIASLTTTGAAENLSPAGDLVATYPGRVSVAGGIGAFVGARGEDGTAVLYRAKAEGQSLLSVAVEPSSCLVTMSPAPGLSAYPTGGRVEASVDPYSYTTEARNERLVCTGYQLKDSSGAIVAEGTEPFCTIESIDRDMTLTWLFGNREYLVDTAVVGEGEVEGSGWYPLGSPVVFTARPPVEGELRMWLVDRLLDRSSLASPRISFLVNGPMMVTAVFSGGSGAETKRFAGPSEGRWDDPANWEPAGVPGLSSDVVIPEGTVVDLPLYAAVRSLSLAPSAVLSVCGKTTGETEPLPLTGAGGATIGREAADHTATEESIGLGVLGDVVLGEGARLTIGGYNQLRPAVLAVGGSFRAERAASFQVYGGPTNATMVTLRTGGSRVTVLGSMTLAPETTTTLSSQLVTTDWHAYGRLGPVVLDVGFLDLAEGASILSQAGSSFRTIDFNGKSSHPSFCSGGGHGGVGGGNVAGAKGGATYGNAFAPVWPGYPGRDQCNFGGGIVRIDAGGVRLAGTIDVTPVHYGIRYEQGGGSGGSIWITADQWSVAPTARLLACGQNAEMLWGSSTHNCGGGGGGRIALGRSLTASDIDSLYATGDVVRKMKKVDLLSGAATFFRGTVDVAGGAPVNAGEAGGTGTAWLLDAFPEATLFLIR